MKTLRRIATASFATLLALQFAPSLAQPSKAHAPKGRKYSVSAIWPAAVIQAALAAQNECLVYTYDQNGNRLTQSTSGLNSSSPTWGSSTFACFTWSAN